MYYICKIKITRFSSVEFKRSVSVIKQKETNFRFLKKMLHNRILFLLFSDVITHVDPISNYADLFKITFIPFFNRLNIRVSDEALIFL